MPATHHKVTKSDLVQWGPGLGHFSLSHVFFLVWMSRHLKDLWPARASITWRLKWLWRLRCNFQLKGVWPRGWGCCQWGQREEFCTVSPRALNRQQDVRAAVARGPNTYGRKAQLQNVGPKGLGMTFQVPFWTLVADLWPGCDVAEVCAKCFHAS